jgi:hypothetical protein
MLRDNIQSELFVELSNKQQQFIAGGSPFSISSNLSQYFVSAFPAFSNSIATPAGLVSKSFALPAQFGVFGGQIAIAGVPPIPTPPFPPLPIIIP